MFRMFRWIGLGLTILLALVAVSIFGVIQLSAASEDGDHVLPGLVARVEIQFDSNGVPSVQAQSRTDAYEALGYLSARDRLFQMDLFRRQTAGRLAEIFGEGVAEADIWYRVMGFERLADVILERLPAEQRAVLASYSAGVNEAMNDMRVLPVEFTFLGYRPSPWRPQDSILVLLGVSAQHSNGEGEERMATVMRRALPPKVVEFLTPESNCYNEILAPRDPARCAGNAAPIEELERLFLSAGSKRFTGLVTTAKAPHGSNAWVIGRQRTRDGRAIIANDMHLALTVPNVWYRAELRYPDVKLCGLTIPGLPFVVSGSNGHVAWGFTSINGDFTDLVRIEHDDRDATNYRTAEGSRSFTTRTEAISVRGAQDKTIQVRETIWGPVLREKLLGEEVAIHWTALDPSATNFDLIDVDQVTTVSSALALFHHAGGPPLNVLMADRAGDIGWTLMGKLPKRVGMDGLFSESWADGKHFWRGYLLPDDIPSQVNPRSGFLVNTNQRMLGRADFEPAIGHDFPGGFRAFRVSERLRDRSALAESDMLALQLDTTTDFYRYYQTLALRALNGPGSSGDTLAPDLRADLEAWDGRAEVDSLGFPLINEFREVLIDEILSPIVARCREVDPAFEYYWSGIDHPVRGIIESGRPELLPDRKSYRDWQGFIRAALEKSARRLAVKYRLESIIGLTWGRVNTVDMTHPLSSALPLIGRFLDMPRQSLAGCVECVRYTYGNTGANARMIVAPGHESDGQLEMAGGQSGQPLSTHYADQQEDWVAGLPTKFLPGQRKHSMILNPTRAE
ncbi:penicillin acylase family protein [Methylocystis bryophila]|uniref:Penicillin acylase family protein n=1 Tax=Methylocystis bryophila TaxID=655015 RepID=A0A1W6N2E3_9HYPH|nr:penicillin acylase family protein [Methylocystis bryophila]ARN83979.1 penicillin acylase family protein [Methylocystis bryophila]BDV41023.1 penicillin amidase [Methylocystis bryophila]